MSSCYHTRSWLWVSDRGKDNANAQQALKSTSLESQQYEGLTDELVETAIAPQNTPIKDGFIKKKWYTKISLPS